MLKRIADALNDIGYQGELLRQDYKYAVLSEEGYGTRSIPLAGFAQTPPSYRSACIGVVCTNGLSGEANVSQHHDLGAPLVFEVVPKHVRRWVIRAKGEPELKESVPHRQIARLLTTYKSEWAPDRIFRAKSLLNQAEARQLDFYDAGYFPLLESMIKEKLDELLRDALRRTKAAYRKSCRKAPDPRELFRLVFRFVAAKTLRDRGQPGEWTDDDPVAALDAVERHYNTAADKLTSPVIQDQRTLQTAWDFISKSLHFQNLSVDDLAFVYENTLITRETRKTFGTHSTPSSIAEYLVKKLPIDGLPQNKRRILEPCSGHGAFLIAAMRRLRELLPASMSYGQRHSYLTKRLVGIEIDTFAVEVCRLSLMLADYPNPNNWRIHNEDAFAWDRFAAEVKKADCVLCNPPFEDFSAKARSRYKGLRSVHQPEEILLRVLLTPPSMLGFVLPRTFLTGAAYRKAREELAKAYREIELVGLPDRVFNHSDAESALVLAWDKRQPDERVHVTCRTVDESTRDAFLREHREPSSRTVSIAVDRLSAKSFDIWIPRLSRLWAYLADLPRLGEFADIHRGIEYNIPLSGEAAAQNRARVFSNVPRKGFVPGLEQASGNLRQFALRGAGFLNTDRHLTRGNAAQYEWDKAKILANAARASRGPWRIAAVRDTQGLCAYQRLHGIWPRTGTSGEYLAALLNGPVANGYVYSVEGKRDNRIRTLRSIPVPVPSDDTQRVVIEKVRKFERLLKRHMAHPKRSRQCELQGSLLEIDAEILKAYDLPPVLERELLDLFGGHKRPIPFEFTGYYPEGFKAYLPLHLLISDEFEQAQADRLLERLRPIDDQAVHEALELARGSDA